MTGAVPSGWIMLSVVITSFAGTAVAGPGATTGAVGGAVVTAAAAVSVAGAASAIAVPVPAAGATGVATMPASSAANASATPVGAASCPCCWSWGDAGVARWTGVLVSMGAVSMVFTSSRRVVVMPQAILRPPANCPA